MPIAAWGPAKASAPAQSGSGGQIQRWTASTGPVDAPRPAKQATTDAGDSTPKANPKTSLLGKVVKGVNDLVVKPVVTTGEKAVNTVGAGTAGVVGLGTAGVQAATGNKKGAKETLKGTQEEMNSLLTKGAGGKGAYLTPKQAEKGGTSLIKPATQAITDIAPLVLPVGKAAEGASLFGKVAGGAVTNAAVAGGTTVANEAIQGNLTKDRGGEIAKNTLLGGVVGGFAPLLHGAVEGASATGAREALQTAKQNHMLDKVRSTTPEPVAEPKPTVNSVPANVLAESEAKRPPEPVPKVSNRQQTEYNPKPGKPVTNVPIDDHVQPTDTPEIKTSKLALNVEKAAIKKGLADGFEGKPEYANVNKADQLKAAVNLLQTDPDKAVRIAMGQEHPPEGLLPESAFIAVSHQAQKTGDVDLLRRLATESSLTSEATGMGQRISMLTEHAPHSAVSGIRAVSEARRAAVEKRLGKPVAKATQDEVRAIKAAKPKVTRETVDSFIEGLKC